MKQTEQNISPFVESLFPSFYQEEGTHFVEFVKAYYEWMETEGNESRKLLEYSDVDYTVDEFLNNFRNQFLNSLPVDTITDIPFLVKHIQDLYKSKGSTQSYKLLFRLLFDQDIEVYEPGRDVLKASDGIWILPKYLECSRADRSFTYVGKQITGTSSGATAFVDNVIRKRINGRYIDILYLSGISGTFETGENVTDNGVIEYSPSITGSLNFITVTDGGSNNGVGDLFTITGDNGRGGKAIVREVANGTGKVAFTINESGFGYNANSDVIISNSIVTVTNATSDYQLFDNIVQPLREVAYANLTSSANLNTTTVIVGYNVGNTAVANGIVVSVDVVSNTTGNVIMSDTGGDWSNVVTIRQYSNTSVFANVSSSSNATANATVAGMRTGYIGIYDLSDTFYTSAYIQTVSRSPIGLSTTVTTTANIVGNNTTYTAEVAAGDVIFVRANSAIIGTVASVVNNTLITLTSNSAYAVTENTLWKSDVVGTANTTRVYNAGTGATFTVGTIEDSETASINIDILNANNVGNIAFMDMLISGTNSNVASNGYGFTANSALTYNSIISSSYTNTSIVIGSVAALASVNPGNNYNASPTVTLLEDRIAIYDKRDIIISVSNNNNLFVAGDNILQSVPATRYALTMSSNSAAFTVGEGVVQTTSGATGLVTAGNSTILTVTLVSGAFVSGNNVVGQASTANAVISAAASSVITSTAKGEILDVDGNDITVKRLTFNTPITAGLTFYSIDSGEGVRGTGYANTISEINPRLPMGLNANISGDVGISTGIVSTLELLSSGFGYLSNNELTLTGLTDTTAANVVGLAVVQTHGRAEGFWKNNQGKLNSDKYIHDNRYYQEFSYEIRSNLSLNSYADILKKVLHVSGMELYGKTIVQSERGMELTSTGIELTENV